MSEELRLEFARALVEQARLVNPSTVPTRCRDADDNHVLAVALAVPAECVCSGDDDLLAIGEFDGIPILSPAQFAGRVGAVR